MDHGPNQVYASFFPILYLRFSTLNRSVLFQRLPFVVDIGVVTRNFLRQRSKMQNGFKKPNYCKRMVIEQ